MRKILRNIAKANMRNAGVKHMNKPRFSVNLHTKQIEKHPSYFAENWRNFV